MFVILFIAVQMFNLASFVTLWCILIVLQGCLPKSMCCYKQKCRRFREIKLGK